MILDWLSKNATTLISTLSLLFSFRFIIAPVRGFLKNVPASIDRKLFLSQVMGPYLHFPSSAASTLVEQVQVYNFEINCHWDRNQLTTSWRLDPSTKSRLSRKCIYFAEQGDHSLTWRFSRSLCSSWKWLPPMHFRIYPFFLDGGPMEREYFLS